MTTSPRLDVWMAGDAFRVAIPSIDRVLSGKQP